MNDSNDTQPGAQCDRRTLLLGAGSAAAAGIAATLAAGAPARAEAQGTVGQECMTILYPNGPDVRFDFEYYEKTHMRKIMDLYGKCISRFELRRGVPGADGAPPPFAATITIWIADPKAFDEANAKHNPGLRADIPKFTNAQLVAQRDRIVGTAS